MHGGLRSQTLEREALGRDSNPVFPDTLTPCPPPTPESLTDIDFHLWREDFPTRYSREPIEEYSIPGVGAYGEVLVHHLGGEWIARQKFEEVQVRVGRRVWFPFLLARHYLEIRQSLIDHSRTRLFLLAARHRD